MSIAENFLSIRVSDGGGGVCHLPKGFSKNGRGLGFSDTTEEKIVYNYACKKQIWQKNEKLHQTTSS